MAKRIPAIWFVAGLALFCAPLSAFAQAKETTRPNLLVVLTDDQGWPTLGCYGGKIVPTPNLDRLANHGVRFTDAYVTSQCTPTRASLLTGQYTARNGLWHVLPWYGYPWARVTEPMYSDELKRDTFTLAKGLRGAGYQTAIVGKWHLTNNADGNYMGLRPSAARHYGFDDAPEPIGKEYFAEGSDRGVVKLTRDAIKFIRQQEKKPWFCLLSHHMIHGKVVAPKEIEARYKSLGYGEEGPNRAIYLAGLECIDRSMGMLVEELQELGQLENTFILFLSDNGGVDQRRDFRKMLGSDRPPKLTVDQVEYDNAPLRDGKGSTYEGGTRVPMIAHWPDGIVGGQVCPTPVHVVDIMPTLFELAGASVPEEHHADGVSLLSLMRGADGETFSQRPIFQYYPFYDLRWALTPNASVRIGDYKLIEFFGDKFSRDDVYLPGAKVELYNLREDIGESHDLASVQQDRVANMRQVLHDWMDRVPAEVPTANPHFEASRCFEETREKPPWIEAQSWQGDR